MIAPSIVCLSASLDGASAVREERMGAVWLAPAVVARGVGEGQADALGSRVAVLPLGVEIGGQVTTRLLVSAALSYHPTSDSSMTQIAFAARWFLLDRPLSPTLEASAGVFNESIADSKQTLNSPFVAVGAGGELALPSGFSVIAGVRVGPENRVDNAGRRWQPSLWASLGAGYRF
jgi:hypothetical protein